MGCQLDDCPALPMPACSADLFFAEERASLLGGPTGRPPGMVAVV